MDITKRFIISKYTSESVDTIEDTVIVERPLNIYINNVYYITLMCTPNEIKELCLGFLYSEGIISEYSEVKSIDLQGEESVSVTIDKEIPGIFNSNRAIVSGCARGSVHVNMLNKNKIPSINSTLLVSGEKILKYMKEFNTISKLFVQTGGVHSCCLCCENGIELVSEDIGRHNALDKLIGKGLMNNMDFSQKILLATGRISSDILAKTAKAGIPVLASHSAPTDLAVNMARSIRLTLIGFVRGSRMNIYCEGGRVVR